MSPGGARPAGGDHAPGSPTGGPAPADASVRERIARADPENLFVEAGAGTGKTTALISRILGLLAGGAPVTSIAAITYTERAAAELADRLRHELERRSEPWAADALAGLDDAAVCTLHAFAHRILAAFPLEAGLPPGFEVRDEISSLAALDQRFVDELVELLEDPVAETPVAVLATAGVRLERLVGVARFLEANWDLLEPHGLLAPPEPLPGPGEISRWAASAARTVGTVLATAPPDDRLTTRYEQARDLLERLAGADPGAAVELLGRVPRGAGSGRKGAWVDVAAARGTLDGLAAEAAGLRSRIIDGALRWFTHRLAVMVAGSAEERRVAGTLDFHDLLVRCRGLLRHPRHGPEIRRRLRSRWRHLLLDEFQDTDPIQIEIATLLCDPTEPPAERWPEARPAPGSLFIVGDPKQSIYRFRRADIATYLTAATTMGEPVHLTVSFRSTAGIIEWVNRTFSQLIRPVADAQPPYVGLVAHRTDHPSGPAVAVTGEVPHADEPDADTLRAREAEGVVRAALVALTERWEVTDGDRCRPCRPGDIAILLPARTSLEILEDALDRAGLPYANEASSLVYRAPELRDLLVTLRAVDDPTDGVWLVAALRSPLFGCGDDDLWDFRRRWGRLRIDVPPPPEAVAACHPVGRSLAWLHEAHRRRMWMRPSLLIEWVVRDRRMFELALAERRPTEAWRRIRWFVEEARAWSEAERGTLGGLLDWVANRTGGEGRVPEVVLPETDVDAVRILTVHAAKGLEFPIVILSGTGTLPRRPSGPRVRFTADGYEVALSADVSTEGYDRALALDEQLDHHERVRLLYVAATRARDHLVVSTHRTARHDTLDDEKAPAAALLHRAARAGGARWRVLDGDGPDVAAPAPSRWTPRDPGPERSWHARRVSSLTAARRARTVAATGLGPADPAEGTAAAPAAPGDGAGTRPPVVTDGDPGLAKHPRDLDLPPWLKGRYGTALGRAVHGALQTLDLATTDDEVITAVAAAQDIAEGVGDPAGVEARVRAALASPVVRRAARRPHRKEVHVATEVHGVLLEGYVDLVIAEDDGTWTVVDYKTDRTDPDGEPPVDRYRHQCAAYALALEAATGIPVGRCVLVFVRPDGTLERDIGDVPAAVAEVVERIRSMGAGAV